MRLVSAVVLIAGLAGSSALAAECPGNPNAIGTSRVLVVDPKEHTRIGTMQYGETLPLADHEVVLTFDDGPLPPNTSKARDILASECVKATFFMIGRMAHAYPDEVRKTFEAGHTVGTHSQNHPLTFEHMTPEKFEKEIDDGVANVAMALGDPTEVAPFFRIPGLLRQASVEDYLASRGIMTWSADFPADDWKHIRSEEIIKRALSRLEAKGRGVLLLHDIQKATVAALPVLLHELKARGYKIVHVVAATADQPKTATTPDQWVLTKTAARAQWTPMAVTVQAPVENDLPAASLQNADALFNPAPSLPAGQGHATFIRGRTSAPVTAAEPLIATGSFRVATPATENVGPSTTAADRHPVLTRRAHHPTPAAKGAANKSSPKKPAKQTESNKGKGTRAPSKQAKQTGSSVPAHTDELAHGKRQLQLSEAQQAAKALLRD